MSSEAFMDAMFELCDIWTLSIDAEEYATFLKVLLKRVTRDREDGTAVWKDSHDVRYMQPRAWSQQVLAPVLPSRRCRCPACYHWLISSHATPQYVVRTLTLMLPR